MKLFDQWRNPPKEKSKEELDAHFDEMDKLEKGDFPAMLLAGFITFLPILLIIGAALLLVMWLFGAL